MFVQSIHKDLKHIGLFQWYERESRSHFIVYRIRGGPVEFPDWMDELKGCQESYINKVKHSLGRQEGLFEVLPADSCFSFIRGVCVLLDSGPIRRGVSGPCMVASVQLCIYASGGKNKSFGRVALLFLIIWPSLFRIPGRRDVTPARYSSSHPISQREYGCRCLSEAKERGRLVCKWPISYICVCHLPYLSFDLLPRSLLSENSQPLNFFFEATNQPDLKLDRVVRERTETFVFKVGQPCQSSIRASHLVKSKIATTLRKVHSYLMLSLHSSFVHFVWIILASGQKLWQLKRDSTKPALAALHLLERSLPFGKHAAHPKP